MKMTLTLDDALVKKARELTGIEDASEILRLGLRALIARESGRRLIKLGGSMPNLKPIRRRRN